MQIGTKILQSVYSLLCTGRKGNEVKHTIVLVGVEEMMDMVILVS